MCVQNSTNFTRLYTLRHTNTTNTLCFINQTKYYRGGVGEVYNTAG